MYWKQIISGYLTAIGTGKVNNQITEAEHNHIKSIIDNRPKAPDGYGYRLTDELEWELYELPPKDPVELSETEQKALAYDILTGVSA